MFIDDSILIKVKRSIQKVSRIFKLKSITHICYSLSLLARNELNKAFLNRDREKTNYYFK